MSARNSDDARVIEMYRVIRELRHESESSLFLKPLLFPTNLRKGA